MNFKLKTLSSVLCVSLLAVPALAGCEDSNKKEEVSVKETNDSSINKNVESLQKKLTQLEKALSSQDAKSVKKQAEAMNDQWLSFENEVREKYPLLYTDVEKYLQPIYLEASKDKMDVDEIKSNTGALKDALDRLNNAKETALKTSDALSKAVEDYKNYVNKQTQKLVESTNQFTQDVKAKDLKKAKGSYADARVYYERIEPIAESFGDLDPKIDAREGDVDPAEWSGFHLLEKAIWEEGSLEGMDKYADQLDKDVKELNDQISKVDLEPTQVVAGAMELLNEAAISKVTGEEERYSHIDLVDLAANVEGSKAVYHAILPALTASSSDLAGKLDNEFTKLEDKLGQYRKGDHYVSYTDLTKDQIRELSQQLNVLSEMMAQSAEVFQ
ncbi:iron uptake system protein EfeO [Falsibacillus pallidus]|uniref:Iron uptake system component EfeO n=1 Tax=Falsibacillus pallidus TaxID=493781 RepID=A0A370GR85_9BACI|nr:iron uptake system protein EfeO [Falsibacillus pallidus]RDI45919.1 iron uptake system component EfeO [Falsibacillus pallidus]